MVPYILEGNRGSVVFEVKYCCSTVMSSAICEFIINEDSVGDVPITDGYFDSDPVSASVGCEVGA